MYNKKRGFINLIFLISLDRLWSVTWPIQYRKHNSGRRSWIVIIITWCLVNAMWLPAFIHDRYRNVYAADDCIWDPKRNFKSVESQEHFFCYILTYLLHSLINSR